MALSTEKAVNTNARQALAGIRGEVAAYEKRHLFDPNNDVGLFRAVAYMAANDVRKLRRDRIAALEG